MSSLPTHRNLTNLYKAVSLDDEETRIAVFKDSKLRLLMTLAGLERVGDHDDPDASWIVPSALSAENLRETAQLVERHRQDPVMQHGDEDPISVEEMLQRKAQPQARRSAFDEDSGLDSDDFAEEEFAFPADAPAARRSTALEELKKKRRKRQKHAEVDDETLEERRKARRRRERERRANTKSELYVHDSDDNDDEERDLEFFRSEKGLKDRHAAKVVGLMQSHSAREIADKKRKGENGEHRARKKARLSDDDLTDSASDENDDDDRDVSELPADGVSSPSMQGLLGLGLGTSENDDSDTPMSSPADRAGLRGKSPLVEPNEKNVLVDTDVAMDDERLESDVPTVDETPEDEETTRPAMLVSREPRDKVLPANRQDANDEDEEDEDQEEDVAASGARSGRVKHRVTVIDSDDE